jgi:hypothetical protein
MVKPVICLLMLGLCVMSLTACVAEPAPAYSRPGAVWVPGHDSGWRWVPGHWA